MPPSKASLSLCQSLREGCSDVWQSLRRDPFSRELATATLHPDRFRLFADASAERRRRLAENFAMSARLEHGYWDTAYGLEQWPDLREVA
jgi:thiaminase